MTNYIRELHPWAAVIYMVMSLFLIMASPYNYQMILVFVLLSINCICSLGAKTYLKSLKFYIVIILFLGVFNMIFNPKGNTVFLYINDRPFTQESLLYGVYMGFMVAGIFIWFLLFQDIFDNRKITWLIGSRLPVTGLIISMVFCYYEKFLTKIHKIQEVWNTYAIKEAKDPLKKAGIILSVLLSVMLEDSVDTAMSMNARGYGKGKRSSYVSYSFHFMDALLIAASVVMFIMFLWKPSHLNMDMVVFLLLPVIYNMIKELQWKYYLSKI